MIDEEEMERHMVATMTDKDLRVLIDHMAKDAAYLESIGRPVASLRRARLVIKHTFFEPKEESNE
jgi:hypothetical protein